MEFEENIGRIFSELISMYGGIGLAFVSFAAATILPFSSEAALVLALISGLSTYEAIVWASFGNCTACIVNYFLGYSSETFVHKKLESSPTFLNLYQKIKTFGWPVLLLSFLPIIGDPITILSGFFKQKLWLFVSIVFTLRIVRYVLLAFVLNRS
ncbi:YqaA family protein [Leptospira kirschneri]|uniref:SNARE-like domain protein n=1 Tax=Leptospira kirschneri str. 200802841 TaxID=1193047 RepID=A0A828Y8Z0_9LEPT|nr:VTT domain-containing protein [Leptospira kirschneri]EJO71822.1 SNARE-like domain protein [Leptospira kirschneri serovar Grippotyphosa str. RM52]EKO53730.1 SNARE-like domain protein [Leptospira kirschneri str. 200802841]EKQ85430.1 SNARE-like domain protein [Leptospira kirschneri serovar Grippotyphosa str. Moskva]EKR09318.1 SNARE-like domain protein [Leptospira kirschneri serovar Valbuzzi str. 200702274]EMK04132.1 SNARE-like domain protein [Leptospira kirschneri str. MMD1493]